MSRLNIQNSKLKIGGSSRREFIKRGVLLVPAFGIFVPRLIRAASIIPGTPARGSGSGGAPPPCTTLHDTNAADVPDDFGWSSDWQYFAFQFVAGGTYNFCDLAAWLFKTGTPTGTLRMGIFTGITTTVTPNTSTQVGTWSNNINASSLSGTKTYMDFGGLTGAGATINNGSTYFGVLNTTQTPDEANIVHIEICSYSGGGSGTAYLAANGSANWISAARPYNYGFKTFATS
jgi:hypothetical protein